MSILLEICFVLCLIHLQQVCFLPVAECFLFSFFNFPNQSLSFISVSMIYRLCHATLDTSYHSAASVHCFMDFVPSLKFLLRSHVCHTRLPFHYSSSSRRPRRCTTKGFTFLLLTKNVRQTSELERYDIDIYS